jgi:hypothetical protein
LKNSSLRGNSPIFDYNSEYRKVDNNMPITLFEIKIDFTVIEPARNHIYKPCPKSK